MQLIMSRKNARVREWRRLRRPEAARASSRVLIEGAHAVLQALRSGSRVEALLLSPELAGADVMRRVGPHAAVARSVHYLSAEAYASLSNRDGPPGVAAVVELRVGHLDPCSLAPRDIAVALCQVENPGNLGTIIRTADSFGVRAVILVGRCTNPYHPLAAKASMGAIFHTPLLQCADLPELRAWCDRQGAALVGTSARGTLEAGWWRPSLPLVLLFGREGGGLGADAITTCDYTVRIEMRGVNSSLNLATAASILTYWCFTQRPATGACP